MTNADQRQPESGRVAVCDDPSSVVRHRYDRLAPVYDFISAPMELLGMGGWRRQLISLVRGPRVLEAGVGTGKNLPYYSSGLSITAIDLSPKMLARAQHKHCASSVEHRVMDVERLDLPDNSFDTIVASFLFCSVANPVRGLRELHRVLKPDGQVLLLEHVRPPGWCLGRLFDLLNPFVVWLQGANINRNTVENVRQAGLVLEKEINLSGKIVKLLVCTKGPQP
jgi:phosphatidylethanolamine/phosphatidyl-N-methylethanolamine N-methyltransferase